MKNATLAEMYGTLNQLVEAYTAVMDTFGSIVTDVQELRQEVAELRALMRTQLADATTARDIWRATAEAHKAQAAQLKSQIEAMKANGC